MVILIMCQFSSVCVRVEIAARSLDGVKNTNVHIRENDTHHHNQHKKLHLHT